MPIHCGHQEKRKKGKNVKGTKMLMCVFKNFFEGYGPEFEKKNLMVSSWLIVILRS